jgi:hypothetical protein
MHQLHVACCCRCEGPTQGRCSLLSSGQHSGQTRGGGTRRCLHKRRLPGGGLWQHRCGRRLLLLYLLLLLCLLSLLLHLPQQLLYVLLYLLQRLLLLVVVGLYLLQRLLLLLLVCRSP